MQGFVVADYLVTILKKDQARKQSIRLPTSNKRMQLLRHVTRSCLVYAIDTQGCYSRYCRPIYRKLTEELGWSKINAIDNSRIWKML